MTNFPADPKEVLARIDARRRPRPALDSIFANPRDAIEQRLVGAWSEVLGLNAVGIDDNFFALGGDSLHMTQISSRLRGCFATDLSFEDFFDCPTVAGLASLLRVRWNKDDAAQTGERSRESEYLSTAVHVDSVSESSVSHHHIVPRLPQEGDRLQISSVVVPTHGRPAALKRCLMALFENLNRYGHAPRIIVADGTPEGDLAEANREAIRQALRGFHFDVLLIGAREKSRLAEQLIGAGLRSEVVRFAFRGLDEVGEGSGANRNLLLLLTGGEAFLSVDDDTECRFACSPAYRPTLGIETGRRRMGDEPADVWVYPSRESILSSVPLFGIDVLDCHLEVLGRQVAHLATATQADSRLSTEDLIRLRDGGGRVVVTLHGIVGDCGWGSPSQYLFLGDSSFERLTSSEQSYATGTSSREMLRIPSSLVVTEQVTNLMTTAFAADNRRMLPPFVSVGRGSDVVFGQMLKYVEPTSWFGHVPWAVLHAPMDKRRFWLGEVLRSAATTDIREMFCTLLSCTSANGVKNPDENLQKAGQLLLGFSNQPVREFCGLLLERVGPSVDGEVTILANRLERIRAPHAQWHRDASEYIQRLKKSRNQITAAIPGELLYGRDIDEAALLARKTVSIYGELLCSWPEMIHAIRNFKEQLIASCTCRG